LRARKCETATPAIYLPGRRRETELPRDWRGSKITAWSSIGFDFVSKYVVWRAQWKNLRGVAAPVQNWVRVSRVVRRRSTCRKRAQWRPSTGRFLRIVESARPSPHYAAL
jgi:hypothetical protein